MRDQPPDLVFEEDTYKKKRLKLRYGRLIFLLLIAAAAVFAAKEYTGAVVYDNLAAKVGAHEITLQQLDEKYALIPPQYQALLTKSDMLNQIIEDILVVEDAKSKGYAVSDDELKLEFSNLKAQAGMDDEMFIAHLKENGVELEKLLVSLKNKLMIQKMIDAELFSSISISEESLKNYYDSNMESFAMPEQVKAKHILLSIEEGRDADALTQITDILNRYNAGEKFEDLAKKYSKCPSAVNGGDLGYFSKGQMVKEFEEAAFSTKAGEVSGPIRTQFGYHIILVEEKTGPKTQVFDDVRGQIEELLKRDKQELIFRTYVAQLKSRTDMEIYFKE